MQTRILSMPKTPSNGRILKLRLLRGKTKVTAVPDQRIFYALIIRITKNNHVKRAGQSKTRIYGGGEC